MSRKLKRSKKKPDDFALAQSMNEAGSRYSSGDLQGALAQCLVVIESHGDIPQALHMAGLASFQLGDASQAAKLLGKYCRLNRNDGEAQYNLGVVLHADGQLEAAGRAYLAAIKIDPAKPEAYNNLGSVYELLGRLSDGEAAYRKGMAVAPQRIESPNNLGLLLHNSGRHGEAETLFRHCLELLPDEPNVLNNLGNVLKDTGRFEAAITVYKKVFESDSGNPMTLNNLGLALQGAMRHEEAREAFNRVLFSHPGDVDTHLNLAALNVGFGDTAGAEKELREALKSEPENAKAYNLLMRVKKVTGTDDPDLINLKALLEKPNGDVENLQHLNLALFEVSRDFKYLKVGNDIKTKRQPFDLKVEKKRFQTITAAFNKDTIEAWQGGGLSSDKPVFILGMPRSGTTLVEQILASHSNVFGGGELKNLSFHVDQASTTGGAFTQWTRDTFNTIAQNYLDDMDKLDDGALRLSDKMPVNFLYIGVIRLALPNARIIHCTRDPMDTCFSCYQRNFSSGQLFSNDMTILGKYYRLYQDLMAHWHDVFPGDIYDLSYEEMVENPEQSIRQLLDYCDLDWQDDCLNFHANKRHVQTASALQVRKPIYKSSVKAWTRYEEELAPMVKALKV
jgi:Flp pilus assembly protein TadD